MVFVRKISKMIFSMKNLKRNVERQTMIELFVCTKVHRLRKAAQCFNSCLLLFSLGKELSSHFRRTFPIYMEIGFKCQMSNESSCLSLPFPLTSSPFPLIFMNNSSHQGNSKAFFFGMLKHFPWQMKRKDKEKLKNGERN